MKTKKITAKIQLVNRIKSLAALEDYRVLAWIWHALVLSSKKGKEQTFALHLHSAVASCKEIYSYPDLRKKLVELVKEAAKRRDT